jgi:hypothetical protein
MSYYLGFRSHAFFVNEQLAMTVANHRPRRDVFMTFPEGSNLLHAKRELFNRKVMRELVAHNVRELEKLPDYSEIYMWDGEESPPKKAVIYVKIDGVWEIDDRSDYPEHFG